MKSILVINEISLLVHLGCLEAERQEPQLVKVRVRLIFGVEPVGVTTDQLADTACYDEITQTLKAVGAQKHFKLVEHLAGAFFLALREGLDAKTKIDLEVTKVNPPVNEITGGVTFTYGESE